ncbi:related to transcription activator protein acu-15 [Fusarium fujikuroi]|nr:related to transcription activator protein acu-15 [Fusarium fujikuroi]
MSSSTQDQPRPRKRHRIAESCKLCRSKKTRCDGRRPTCSSCQSKNTACEYNEPNVVLSSDILSKMADLEARVQALESLPSNFTGSFHVATGTPSPLPRHGNAQSSIVDNPTLRFISSVTQTAPTGGSDIQTQPANPNDRATSFAGMNMSQVVLPSREVADDFIECYERLVYPMFSVLHMPSFKARYLRVWESPSNDQALDTTFAASLNIVFALGCLNSSNTEPSLILSTAETFYERSRSILPLDSLDRPSIEVVQYLLLTGNYLSFTKYSHRYCNTLAMAIQVAQTIDLHRADHDTTSQLQREMGRRVWHLCLTMQSVLIHDNTCPLPQMIDDEYLLEEGEGCQPAATPSLLDALAVSMKIFDVVAGVREVNAASFSKALQMPELMKILQLNERLTEIEDNLPEHLKYKSGQAASSAREKVLHYQAEVVNLRWLLYVRLLVLRTNLLPAARQVLARQDPSTSPSRLEHAVRKEAWHICIQSAVTSLDILHTNLQSSSKVISIHAMFVTLSATTVLIASSALPRDPADPPPSHADSITKAFEILDAHQWRAEGVSETRTKLCKFLQTVENENRDPEYEQGPYDPLGGQSDGHLRLPEQAGLFDNIDLGGDLWIPQLDGLLYL